MDLATMVNFRRNDSGRRPCDCSLEGPMIEAAGGIYHLGSSDWQESCSGRKRAMIVRADPS